MRFLKRYEELQFQMTSPNLKIFDICKKFDISPKTINSDGTVDSDKYVDLYALDLEKLPLRFGDVEATFNCSINHITSLEGSPQHVGGDFDCSSNDLTTLVGSPKIVGGHFYCEKNKLTTLVGGPEIVKGNFIVVDNNINSFEGFPRSVGRFDCSANPIFHVWKLFHSPDKIELFNEFDPIRGSDIILDRLNDFLVTIGEEPVESVEGYNNI